MPLPFTVSCFSKIQTGLPFWYRLTQVVPDKGPLNGCVCVYSLLHQLSTWHCPHLLPSAGMLAIRSVLTAISQYLLPTVHSAANPPRTAGAVDLRDRQMDRQTDTRAFRRPSVPSAINRYLLPTGHSAANPLATASSHVYLSITVADLRPGR